MEFLSEPCVSWPYYASRQDCWLHPVMPQSGRILRCFKTGFDAELDGVLVYFASHTEALHPLSFLVPAGLLDVVSEGASVCLDETQLQINGHQLQPAGFVKVEAPPENVACSLAGANLLTLHSTIKLFGRPSIVLPLVTGCCSAGNMLSGVESLLLEPQLDLRRLQAFVGVGEGLTPAFDDFLCGMIFVDRFYGFNQIDLPAGFLAAISRQTTRQAVQQLEFASRGALSLKFEHFARKLALEKIRPHDVVPLLQWGHSSGTDIVCGIWYYLSQRVKIA